MTSRAGKRERPSERARWEAFAVCTAVASLTILDLAKINVGLPTIETSLGGGPTELQLIVADYALAYGLALVPAGRLGDLISRKVMFMFGLSAFTIASVICAMAPTIEVLVVGRIWQGLAAGIQMPQVLGLIQTLFLGSERGKAFGLFGGIIGVSTAFGPTLGGLLIALGGEGDGWRLTFWMNVPLGILALILAIRILPAQQRRTKVKLELDLSGILLLGVAVFSLMLPFVLTTGSPEDDPLRWLWLASFALAAYGFVVWERRLQNARRSPLIKFGLLRTQSYRNGILVAAGYFASTPAIFLLTTLYVQQGLGLPAVFAGMISVPLALVSAFSSWFTGRIIHRSGPKVVALGVLLSFLGYLPALPISAYAPPELIPWLISAFMITAGVGGGMVISGNQTLTLQDVPVIDAGVAGSVMQVGQRAGTAIGTAIAAATYFATIYQKPASTSTTIDYANAYHNGLYVTFGILFLTLIFALVDLRRAK